MSTRDKWNKTFLFYQSIGLIPLSAKRSDWDLHHMDETLKHTDKKRYNQCNVYDVIPLPQRVHNSIHNQNRVMSEKTRKKMSENHADVSGKNNPMFGKKHTEESKLKMSEKQNHIGDKNPMFGRKHSEETKRKMSEKAKQRYAKTKEIA